MLAYVKKIIALSIISWAVLYGSSFSQSSSALIPFFQAPNPEPRTLNPAEKHTYPLTLKTNDFLNLVVEQKGIDVVVRLIAPDGKVLIEVDSPNGTKGPEPLSFIAKTAGMHHLEVESLEKTALPGTYQITQEAIREATEQDRTQVEIDGLSTKFEKLWQAGKYDQALPIAHQAIQKAEQGFGSETLPVALWLNNLAGLYKAQGKYAQAEAPGRRALAIREKTLGPDHPSVANSLNNLARLYGDMGDFARAESLFHRSLAIYEKTLGPDHPETAASLTNLGGLYKAKGDYIQAEPLFVRSLAIYEKALGPTHRETAIGLNNLASLYRAQGEYTKAEPLYLRALAILEKTLGSTHPFVAISLSNLAHLYWAKGDYTNARPLFERSVAIQEKVLGPNHPEIATSLGNLAELLRTIGNLTGAEQLLRRSLAIREKALGVEHPDTAASLNNLAGLLQHKGDSQTAETLLLQALAIREKRLGPDHPDTASSLNNLASLYKDKGDYDRAEQLLRRSLAIREKIFGPGSLIIAQSLNNLAGLYQAKGDIDQAIACRTQSNNHAELDLTRNLVSGSERQKMFYLKRIAPYFDNTISLHVNHAPQNQAAARAALTAVLRFKGRTLDAMTGSIAILRNQCDAETQKLLDDYTNLVGQLSTLTLRGSGTKKPEAHQAELHRLEAQKEKLEGDISLRSAEFRVQSIPITLASVQQSIPPDAALIEFVSYRPYDSLTRKTGSRRYSVYVLKNQGDPQFADLGEASDVDKLVVAFRKELSNPTNSVSKEIKPLARALDKLVMKPVRTLIGPAGNLLICPDGGLNLIPFASLVDEEGKFLMETYRLTYLTSGRDLLRLNAKIPSRQPALIVSDPDYSTGKGPLLAGRQYPPLERLAGTAQEGREIQRLFIKAVLKTGNEATESEMKKVHGAQILHIATHGHFLGDVPQGGFTDDTRNIRLEDRVEGFDFEKLRVNNPLLRSWLFFAGANRGDKQDNDGIMTALEAAQLDLWGTKLVVLSACETGLGQVKNGDGLYGLRRALVLAGSESQVLSLWQISDTGTKRLMTNFYRRLKAGEGRSDALRNAQLDMLKKPKWKHPYYWASFISSGEWANLDGKR